MIPRLENTMTFPLPVVNTEGMQSTLLTTTIRIDKYIFFPHVPISCGLISKITQFTDFFGLLLPSFFVFVCMRCAYAIQVMQQSIIGRTGLI